MKVEIWSDVMCPFCYIGKRKFETALKEFEHGSDISVEWKSFQLNPDQVTDPNKNTLEYLSETKGWSVEQTKNSIGHVKSMAEGVGLSYNFEKAIVANSFDAHRLIQFAKTKNKGDEAEEALFKAYFTDGKNTADHSILVALGKSIGLDEKEVKDVLSTDTFSREVQHDIAESALVGVRGVPFFVVDRKYAISGAQDASVFLNCLKKAWEEKVAG